MLTQEAHEVGVQSVSMAAYVKPQDAEVEDAAQLLAVVLPHAVQVLALPWGMCGEGVASRLPCMERAPTKSNTMCYREPL